MPRLRFQRLRTKLLVWMLAVVFLLTAATLALVQARMREHVREDLVATLHTEAGTFAEVENARHQQTEQSVALIAEQPTLKALMSTNDPATVAEEMRGLLDLSRADLLILENPSGQILGFNTRSGDIPQSAVSRLMQAAIGTQDWWFAGGRLFDVSLANVAMGAAGNRHPLGRVAIGREVSSQSILNTGLFGKTAFAFERHGAVLLSSLPKGTWSEFESSLHASGNGRERVQEIGFEDERYLETFVQLPGDHPVRLYCLQSYDQATSFLRALNQLLLLLGGVVLIVGAAFTFFISRQITRPLERLAFGTQQLEKGDFDFQIAVVGNDEVAGLTNSFEKMRRSLRQSREGLLRSARLEAVGRLAGGVAHDFNNLVMIIKGYSELLLDSATPATKPYIEEIRNAGERASGLTRQLLAFSRKQVLEPQVLDINQTVKNMAKMLRVLIGEDIELITNLSTEAVRVKADPAQLEQVIMNLAVNARDAMPNGGKLTIETTSTHIAAPPEGGPADFSSGAYSLISVMDSGCGMDEETLKHIYEPFFTTKEPGKGTGLGLATVYGIVQQSHGHIAVSSKLGAGTTFRVYLPLQDKSVPVTAVQRAGDAPRGQGTILVVEDEAPLRALAAESLKKLGYSVLQASNGLEALGVADHHSGPIDLLLTDMVMPRMGGPELAAKLREKRGEIAILYMSGYADATTESAHATDKEIGLLNKPFSTEALAKKIAESLPARNSAAKAVAAGG